MPWQILQLVPWQAPLLRTQSPYCQEAKRRAARSADLHLCLSLHCRAPVLSW